MDIFTRSRLAAIDEPYHDIGSAGFTKCGVTVDGALVRHRNSPPSGVDWDGRATVTCIDCDPAYTGAWRRGNRDGALPAGG